MTRALKIKGRTGLFDVPSFLVSENESLTIKLNFAEERRLGRYRLIVRHGEYKKTFSFKKPDPIELSPEWLKSSAENVEFSLVLLNENETAVIKDDYQIEPLKLETVNGNFTFTAILQELVSKQGEQDQKLLGLEERLKQFEDEGVPLFAKND